MSLAPRPLALVPALLLAAAGCMSERPTINRVQPDFLDKADLIPNQYRALTREGQTPERLTARLLVREPVFYTQTTLISKPTTTGFTGLTSYGEPDKIRWQVTENALLARQSFEFVKGAPEGTAGIGENPQTGDVVAVFKITSHFDIRRDYNSTTGEELNVVVENTTDRPWYQRRYMRVDWSQNLITGYNSVFLEQEWDNKLLAEPVPVFVNTPNDPNAPVFEYEGEGEARKLVYFDIVNQAVLHPETAFYSYEEYPGVTTTYSTIPVCELGEYETSCAPAQVTLRVAFRRVDPTRDYEPASLSESLVDAEGHSRPIPHLNMERFGFFDVMRVGYDPAAHATLDTQRVHMATRHNLWLHHHALVYGEDTGTACNGDADCAGTPGAVCRIGDEPLDATHRGACANLAVDHRADDPACSSDEDCRQIDDVTGISRSAVCDAATGTCGERYYRCSSDADCAGVSPLSTCDLAIAYTRADNRGLCLMPFLRRQVRPIPYHESANYPEYMQPVTEQVATEWNDAFSGAVVAARRHECELLRNIDPATADPSTNPCNDPRLTGLDPALGADARFVFVACHSPVWGTAEGAGQRTQEEVDRAHARGWDLPSCGPQGTEARIGDLRYHMIASITDHDAQGYWGLANVAADQETGEMIAGRGAVWQTITEYYAHQLVEIVQLLNGELDPVTVSQGGNLIEGMKAIGEGRTPSAQTLDRPFQSRGLEEIASIGAGLERLSLPGAGWLKPGSNTLLSRDPDHPGALKRGLQRLLEGRTLGDGSDRGTKRLLRLAGTPIEGLLMNADQARLSPSAGRDGNSILPATLEDASPMRGQSTMRRHVIERVRRRLDAWQCGRRAAFNDDLILGLAQRLAGGKPISMSDPDDAPVSFGRDWNFKNPDGSFDYDLMRNYATQLIHHSVLAHEIGHSLGQRHNFTASADAVNYHDNYWRYRLQGHPSGLRPRYEYLADPKDGRYYSKEEIEGRVDEWSYSSVMDYKGLNEDVHGLGRYDYAFIKGGYVNLVEAFRDVKDVGAALTYSINVAGNGSSTPLDLRGWSQGGAVRGQHYTQIPQIFGALADGRPNIGASNRYDVFLSETRSIDVPGWGPPFFTNITADRHVLVPYRFDSDERAGLVWQCQTNDSGADIYETTHYLASRMIDYYFINSFARLRSGFSTDKYVGRMWDHYLGQLRQTTQIAAFDLIDYREFFAGSPDYESYASDPKAMGGYLNLTAMSLAADAMVAMLTMPEVGQHDDVRLFDGSRLISVDLTGRGRIDIPLNDGRYFESDWRADAGFWWFDMLDHAGSYYDKVMMLQAMADPQLLILARDTPSDIRLFQLSFYTMFPDQMIRLFGALLAEDHADFAPIYATADGTIQRPHVATLNQSSAQNGRRIDATHVALDPQDRFTMQLWSAVLTMAQFPATYDQSYMDFTRLWLDGSAEGIQVADPAKDTVSFVDPWSHQTYRALHMGCKAGEPGEKVGCSAYVHPGGGSNEAGIAGRMLLHLQDLDKVRRDHLAAGRAAEAATVERQERKYLDLVNVMRSMTFEFGHGDASTP